jgi:hypothetical protein
MNQKRYPVSKWFVIVNYFCIVIAVLSVALFVFNIITSIREGDISSVGEFVLALVLFGGCGIYSVMILPRLRGNILLTAQGITQEFKDGSTVTISFQEPFEIRERAFLGRVDLIPPDKTRVIMIEKQVKKYDELMDFIWKKQGEALQ